MESIYSAYKFFNTNLFWSYFLSLFVAYRYRWTQKYSAWVQEDILFYSRPSHIKDKSTKRDSRKPNRVLGAWQMCFRAQWTGSDMWDNVIALLSAIVSYSLYSSLALAIQSLNKISIYRVIKIKKYCPVSWKKKKLEIYSAIIKRV